MDSLKSEKASALLDEAKLNIENAQLLISGRKAQHVNTDALISRVSATLFNGDIEENQVNCLIGFSTIYAMFIMLGVKVPFQYLAYVLATTYHETAYTMQPIEEYGKGAGMAYGQPDETTGKIYYGRGYVQLTWLYNYDKATQAIYSDNFKQGDVDLVNHPEKALIPFYAAQIAISGMSAGWFTGKKLSDYLSSNGSFDYVNARRIINGTDKAEIIAGYAHEFETALMLATGNDIERPTIRHGSKGDDVRELQLGLGTNPDGIFGSGTESMLVAFQTKHGLEPDGICGPATWSVFDKEVYGL